MNLRTLVNMMLLGALGYSIYCGYQYMGMRNAILSELKSSEPIRKMIGDLHSVKISPSQYPAVSCDSGEVPSWWELIAIKRSEGCLRLSLDLQSETLRTVTISADYDSQKLIGERISLVMLCRNMGEVTARDNGIPTNYVNCQ